MIPVIRIYVLWFQTVLITAQLGLASQYIHNIEHSKQHVYGKRHSFPSKANIRELKTCLAIEMRQHVANYEGVKLDGATCRQQRKSCRLTCQQRRSLRSSFGVRHRPYLAGEILERHAHSENESDGFPPHYAHEIIKRVVCRSSWIFQFEKNWGREIKWL